MVSKTNILFIGDDENVYKDSRSIFDAHSCNIHNANSTIEFNQIANIGRMDIVILDVLFPESRSLSFCRYLRHNYDIPIIILTDQMVLSEVIIALEVGADCFLMKPVDNRLLLAQTNACLRRRNIYDYYTQSVDPSSLANAQISNVNNEVIKVKHIVYKFTDWQLNANTHKISSSTEPPIMLTNNEYNLLYLLLNMPKMICTRKYIMDKLDIDLDTFDRAIDIIICRLRSKIEEDPKKPKIIKTVRGSGYVLDCSVSKAEVFE
jgi:two-component system, OmpR family, response regulator